ncbi:MAG: GntR family transcriptional regulator [Planctomycetota bacterium]|jgi:DNA-binding GntR family transcriptional regulator|nr:GntR family transcriptional regulator [Planctomycetota bacterium]
MNIPERLPREKARDYALRILRDDIITLALQPGTRVTETALAARLGISRTPVREALVELAAYDLVEIYPQSGVLITKIDYDNIEESRFLRHALETHAVQEVCDLATPGDLAELEDIVAIQRTCLENKESAMLLKMDNQFHRNLFQICGKLKSYNLMQNMLVHFDRLRQFRLRMVKEYIVLEDHRAILDAIRAHDKEKAKQIMAVHLSRSKTYIYSLGEKYPHLIR